MIDLTSIVEAAIALIFAIITTFLIPYIKSKVDANKLTELKEWVKIAVKAAEQIYAGVGRGDEKKQYVLNCLESMGYTIDAVEIENLIESAVLELQK